jgi:phage terminase large subunit-like protein
MLTDDEERQAKRISIERLTEIHVSDYNLSAVDPRLDTYARALIDNPDAHNLYELLALIRFFRFLDTYDFRIDIAQAFIRFFEFLKFDGTHGRQRYKMTPIQVFQFINILGFYLNEKKRLTRNVLLYVPRKFSKTTSISSLAIWDMLFGDSNAQAYTAANSYKQAQICFREIKAILKGLDPKLKNFKLNREKVSFSDEKKSGRSSFIECLAADPDTLDGLNASMVIMDEYSQADSADLYNVLTTSMAVRENPLTAIITTASDKNEAPFVDILDQYKKILLHEIGMSDQVNDRVFAHIFQPDVDDEEDDPKTWAKVQPHLGITVQTDFYELEYARAQGSSEDMKDFRTKLLNIYVSGNDAPWFTPDEINKHLRHLDLKEARDANGGIPSTMVAIDLSVKDDFSAVSYSMYFIGSFHIHTDYYIPEETVRNHPNKELYQKWVKDGYLKICGKKAIDYDMIARDVMARAQYLKILQIGYDPYKADNLVNMLAALGGSQYLQPVSQTYGNFTSPVQTFESAILTDKLTLNDNPINPYCFGNAVLDEDRLENTKPIKRTKNKKIDGAITALMTMKEFSTYTRQPVSPESKAQPTQTK